MAEIPTPDLAVPYAAPKQVNTIADVQPIAPKNGCGSNISDGFIGTHDPLYIEHSQISRVMEASLSR